MDNNPWLASVAQDGYFKKSRVNGYSKAGIVSTVSYSTIAFSMIFGVFIGDSLPNNSVIFGIVLIILSGIMVAKKWKTKKNFL